ncbi:MAG: GAF domain-containing sensor histidine kinase [Acidobacteria bacterium]|nr:GAF domain-containing sensor histidine kinase [Acidobacteriota bacterium]
MSAPRAGGGRVFGGLSRRFAWPGIEGGPWLRLARATDRARVLIGVSALALGLLAPAGLGEHRVALVLLVGLVYLPYGVVVLLASRRARGPALRMGTLAGDVLVVFLIQALVPQVRPVALFGYLLIVAFYSPLSGLAVGVVVSGCASGLTVLAQVAWPYSGDFGGYTLGMFAAAAVTLVLLLDAVTREQRQANARLHLLHRSLRTVASSLDLPEVLDRIAAAARESLGAKLAVVYLKGEDGVLTAAAQGMEYVPGVSHGKEAFDPATTGGSGIALETGRPVVVENVLVDPRFAGHWADIARTVGLFSMIAVPVSVAGAAAGTLSVYFGRPGPHPAPEVELVEAYAEQASLASARALTYEREKTAAARLRDLDHMRSEFLSTISHEVRTPLTAIEGFAETLLRRWADIAEADRLDAVRRIARNAVDLRALIEQILDFSRLEAGWADVRPRPIDLREAVARALEAHEAALAPHPVSVAVGEGLDVEADPDGVQRILGNLVANAAKHSGPGTPIRVAARAGGLEIVVSVSDDGPGISPEARDKVFEPFYQGPRPPGGRAGTGIGLSIARRYVEMHGGRIWVESEPGVGATFSFTLPRAHVTRRPPAVRPGGAP